MRRTWHFFAFNLSPEMFVNLSSILIKFSKDLVDPYNFDFEIVNFPFLDGDGSCSTSYGVYISQLIFVLLENLDILLTSTLTINY